MGLPTFDAYLAPLVAMKVRQQHVLPVATIADQTEVREGTFRRAGLLLHFAEQITCEEEMIPLCSYLVLNHFGDMEATLHK